ncbi:MAG: hypothetical protein ACF8GE_08535 [Phycisphaerales bacterium JB043]
MSTHDNNPSIHEVKRSLRHLRSRARLVLSSQRIMSVASIVLASVLFFAVIDYAIRLPPAIRAFNLVVGVCATAYVVTRWIAPAMRFKPSLSSVALRMERLESSWRGLLTSGIELSDDPSDTPVTRSLTSRVVERAARSWSERKHPRLVRLDGLVRSGVVLSGILAIVLSLTLLKQEMTRIGATRTLLPWVDARWPARTDIESLMTSAVHPSDRAVAFRAGLIRSNWDFASTDVYVRWREVGGSQSERMLLTWQRQTSRINSGAFTIEAQLFERLFDPQHDEIVYRFETEDDTTPWATLTFIDPPAIQEARAMIVPPPYVEETDTNAASDLRPRIHPLGDGADDRAIAPTSLAGSTIELTLELTKPSRFEPDDESWVVETFGQQLNDTHPTIVSDDSQGTRWTVSFELHESIRVPISLVDEYGIHSNEDATFRFPSTEDSAPIISLIDPDRDMEVLPQAVAPLVAEGIDDVGLDSVWIALTHMIPAGESHPSGPGGALRPLQDEPQRVAIASTLRERFHRLSTHIRFEELGAQPGHEVHVQAFAVDTLGAWSSSMRAPSESIVRRFRVLTEEEFLERIQGGLSQARQASIATDEQQARAREMIDQQPPDSMSRRQQAVVSDRITRIIEQLETLQDTVERNQYDDESLSSLLEAARSTLERAGQQSAEASRSIDELLTQQEQGDDTTDSPLREEAREAQQNVHRELEQLAELLDRGEDTWVQRRRLQNLIQAQESLREQTEQISQTTTGQERDELTSQQEQELDRIAEEQRALSEQTEETLEGMRDSLEQLRQNDSVAAAGLEEALRTAQQRNTQELQEQAAEQVEQNRTSRAMSMQQQASQSLQEMLDAMDQALEERDEVLQRLLLNLIESIQSLITSQQSEIASLRDGRHEGRDRAMIRLRTNTLGVHEQAAAGGVELASVASSLTRASDAQSRAIVALRENPPSIEDALVQEGSALELLEEALEQARSLEEEMAERIQDRKQKQLREAYETALEHQIEIHDQTSPYVNDDQLSRRDRLNLRRLGDEQHELAQQLVQLRDEIEDIANASIFKYAHDKLDTLLADATGALRDGRPNDADASQIRAIELLRGLVAATQEDQQEEDEFRQNASGGGSGGSGEQQEQVIPPIAELKLLKQLQQDVYERTRRLDETQDTPDDETVRELGTTQSDLAEIGEELIRKLEENNSPGGNQP